MHTHRYATCRHIYIYMYTHMYALKPYMQQKTLHESRNKAQQNAQYQRLGVNNKLTKADLCW